LRYSFILFLRTSEISEKLDNSYFKECFGWEPEIELRTGLITTYNWIKEEIEKKRLLA